MCMIEIVCFIISERNFMVVIIKWRNNITRALSVLFLMLILHMSVINFRLDDVKITGCSPNIHQPAALYI